MKIEKTSSPPPAIPSSKARASSTKDPSTPSSSTSVNLGTTSAQLRELEGSGANSSPGNAARIAEIKQAISEGRFQVNSGAVADSLIQSVSDLISAQKS